MKQISKAAKAYKNRDFLNSKNARSIRIMSEYFEPFHRFKQYNVKATIVFFGSARIIPMDIAHSLLEKARSAYEKSDNNENKDRLARAEASLKMAKYYEDSVELARRFTEWTIDEKTKKQKYYICSGGGPGIMEAANRGAQLAGGKSIGLNISLPMEQFPNAYISEELNFEFHYFFMRKYWFLYLAKGLVVFPGGFGTLDEMMEALTLIQTRKIQKKLPIAVYGSEYWKEILNLEAMQKWGTISRKDLDLFTFVDSVDDAFSFLQEKLPR